MVSSSSICGPLSARERRSQGSAIEAAVSAVIPAARSSIVRRSIRAGSGGVAPCSRSDDAAVASQHPTGLLTSRRIDDALAA